MNKKLILNLLILTVLISTTSSVFAEVTTKEMRSAEYLKNQGYSEEAARMVDLQRHQTLGEEITKEESSVKKVLFYPVKCLKKLMGYLDPAIDDGDFGQSNTEFQSYEYKDVPNL